MSYHNIYAILNENSVVEDVILASSMTIEDAKNLYMGIYVSPEVIDVTNIDVKIGDFYMGHKFYRYVDKELDIAIEVDSSVSQEEIIHTLQKNISQKESQIEYLEKIIKENGLGKLIE